MEANKRLEQLLALAKETKIVRNQAEFATLISSAPSTISSALRGEGKYMGTASTLVIRAENELMKAGVPVKVVMGLKEYEAELADHTTEPTQEDEKTIAALAETIRSQQKTIESLLYKFVISKN